MRTPFAAALAVLASCSAPAPAPETLDERAWLAHAAIPLEDAERAYRAWEPALAGVRVVALGEATHGQHESFETKRALTMQLVRRGRARLVLYEASSARARLADAYVAGTSDDIDAAMRGFGMLVWQIEENAALLRDLRAWNAAHPRDRVRFAGVDAQDPEAAARRVGEIVGPAGDALVERLVDWGARVDPAVRALWSGDASGYHGLAAEMDALEAEVRALPPVAAADGPELDMRLRELRSALAMHHSPGGRDRAMAEMLLFEIATLGSGERAVLWAHNGHVTRGPLRYLSVDEPGIGGHAAARIGDAYYALGFAFGEGGFQANARDGEGRFGFRRYSLSEPPAGSLESVLAAARAGDWLVDLRSAPRSGPAWEWLSRDHGQRWFGGYGVPDDCDERSRDLASLPVTNLRADYDGLVFLARTTPAVPRDPARILGSAGAPGA